MTSKADVAFVSCVKTKADRPLPAQDLYISPWFRMASAYARQHSDRWFILSAGAGLLNPHRVIDPYDFTLNGLGIKLRKEWAGMVRSSGNDSQAPVPSSWPGRTTASS